MGRNLPLFQKRPTGQIPSMQGNPFGKRIVLQAGAPGFPAHKEERLFGAMRQQSAAQSESPPAACT